MSKRTETDRVRRRCLNVERFNVSTFERLNVVRWLLSGRILERAGRPDSKAQPPESPRVQYNGRVKIITTHLSADFDAFAAAVAAVRLFPDHRVLFPGSQEVAVRRFLAEAEISFPEVRLRHARIEPIEHAVVVDTRSPSRLGEVFDLVAGSGCPVTLIDHHMEEEEDGLDAAETILKPVGSTCTIIADLYR